MINALSTQLIQPIRAMRKAYLPLLMIYFAYGCSAFSGIGETFFIKERLDISASALLTIGVWVAMPWTFKMVFGQLVDSVAILGSRRRVYIFFAALLMVISSLLMAGLAGSWHWVISLGSPMAILMTASLSSAVGFMLQDVVADAMSVEVVPRTNKTEAEINHDLAMVQLLGRLALSLGILVASGLGGWITHLVSYQTLFLLTLAVPLISISGALWVKTMAPSAKPLHKPILIGGLLYALFAIAIGVSNIAYSQEIVLSISLILLIYMLRTITRTLDRKLISSIAVAAVVIFVFRAMPNVGPGAQWFMIDELGFDPAFFGTLAISSTLLSIIGMWLFARWVTHSSIPTVLTWLTLISFVLGMPFLALCYGFHHWTETYFGFGAHTIIFIDNAMASPLLQLSMIPMLALIARNAPPGNAATWFALMSSLMNLALVAERLFSQYLNHIFVITREVRNASGQMITAANYSQLGMLVITVSLIGLIFPLCAIAWAARTTRGYSPNQY